MYDFTFRMYLDSIIANTIDADNRDPIFYYFKFTREDIMEHKEHFKACFNNNVTPVKALIWLENDLKNRVYNIALNN